MTEKEEKETKRKKKSHPKKREEWISEESLLTLILQQFANFIKNFPFMSYMVFSIGFECAAAPPAPFFERMFCFRVDLSPEERGDAASKAVARDQIVFAEQTSFFHKNLQCRI